MGCRPADQTIWTGWSLSNRRKRAGLVIIDTDHAYGTPHGYASNGNQRLTDPAHSSADRIDVGLPR